MDSTSIERLFMRLRGLFGRGRVTYVDDSGPVQKMQVRMNGLITSDNRLRLAEFGFTSNPPFGSDVLALHIAGDNGAGAVFATNDQRSRPRGLAAGESMLYSEDGKQVYLTADGGIVVNAKGQDVVVNNAKDVTWNLSGVLTVAAPGGIVLQGSVTISETLAIENEGGSTNASTMNGSFAVTGDVTAGTVSLQNHLTSGVQQGTQQSGKPVPGT